MPESAVSVLTESSTIFVVDDDSQLCATLALLLESSGFRVHAYPSAEAFLAGYRPVRSGCIILDVGMPGMDGLTLQDTLARRGIQLPIIFLTGEGDVPEAVKAIKGGALDFLRKPVLSDQLLERISAALRYNHEHQDEIAKKEHAIERLERLTRREREILALLVSGMSNKKIGQKLDISHRTVEVHRSRIMEKMSAGSLPELIETARLCDLP
jgi:FixJ family two-component response regulator